ncbi:MAG: glycoside hydrolase family 15 protein [Nitrospirota bacterium]
MTKRKDSIGYDEETCPAIEDYGYIADCHSSALVSKSGSIDWCCMPRVDSASCFGRILDWKRGGFCRIAPSTKFSAKRRYIDGSLILETTFQTRTGSSRLIDCFTMRRGGEHSPHQQILRVVEGLKGRVRFGVDISPRFDYGAIKPWIRHYGKGGFSALGGRDGLLINGDIDLDVWERHHLRGSCDVREGQRFRLSILYRRAEDVDEGLPEEPKPRELDRRLNETIRWWSRWSSRDRTGGPYSEYLRRSAAVLKGLSNAPTGAIAAAPTTSLPESPGGSRNWDYRYSWIRDSYFTVRSLGELGHDREADGFRRFMERSAAGSAEELQILFGVGGERRLKETVIKEMEGYRGSAPVRVGNAAEKQLQLDMYGELLELAWHWHQRGHRPDDDYWNFLVETVNVASRRWREPDMGIWEIRGRPRHFVQSKAMCWVALDRGLKLARALEREAPVEDWERARDEVRRAIESKGYDRARGVFTQAFGRKTMDSALLLLPMFGFVGHRDERMVRTVRAIRKELQVGGLLRRYPPGDDGMNEGEGVFLACSFWLAECLACQGDIAGARKVFEKALSTGNDLGLFSEEYDVRRRRMLGNFPQGLTQLSLVAAAVVVSREEKRCKD